MSLATRLQEIMNDHRPPLTQRDFAARIGMTQGAVAGWIAGAQPYPKTIGAICAEFGVKRDWLMYGEGPKLQRAGPKKLPPNLLQEEAAQYHALEKKLSFIEQSGTREQIQLVDDFLESVCRQLGLPRSKSARRSR